MCSYTVAFNVLDTTDAGSVDEGKLLELLKVVGHEHLTDKDIKLIHDVSSIDLSYSGAVFTVCYAINIVTCVLTCVRHNDMYTTGVGQRRGRRNRTERL